MYWLIAKKLPKLCLKNVYTFLGLKKKKIPRNDCYLFYFFLCMSVSPTDDWNHPLILRCNAFVTKLRLLEMKCITFFYIWRKDKNHVPNYLISSLNKPPKILDWNDFAIALKIWFLPQLIHWGISKKAKGCHNRWEGKKEGVERYLNNKNKRHVWFLPKRKNLISLFQAAVELYTPCSLFYNGKI